MATKKTAKKAVKKTAKKAAKKPALMGTVKLLIGGEELKQSEYYADKGKEFDLPPADVKKMLLSHIGGTDEIEEDEDASPKKNKQIQACFAQLTEDWAEHKKAKAKADAAKEKAKEEAESEKKKKMELREKRATALREVVSSTKVAAPVDSLVKASVKSSLGEKFTVTPGGIKLKKGVVMTDEDWAHAFGDIERLYEAADDMKEGFALRQAQVACLAREKMGDDWINFFSDKPSDVARIKKYMKVVDDVPPKLLAAAPLSNIRAITEAKYDKEDADNNLELKQKALKAMAKEIEDKGKVTQLRAREIRDEFCVEEKDTFKAPKLIYIMVINKNVELIGTESRNELLAKASLGCIDRNAGIYYPIDTDGDYAEGERIVGPTTPQLAHAKSVQPDLDGDDEDEGVLDDIEEEEVEEEVEETEVEETEEETEEEEWEEEGEEEEGEEGEEEEDDDDWD